MAQYNSQGKIIERTSAMHHSTGEAITTTNGLPTAVVSSTQQTIQTHNAISVPLSNANSSAWIDTNGFNEMSITYMNDATASNSLELDWSNDGVTKHGWETPLASATSSRRVATLPTRARYVQVTVKNGDTTAAHVMSAWLYLKI